MSIKFSTFSTPDHFDEINLMCEPQFFNVFNSKLN